VSEHKLVDAYPVMNEKEGEFVAQIKFTALLMANGTVQITGVPVDRSKLQTDCKVSEPVQKLLATGKGGSSAAKKKKKGKKKGGAKKAGGDGDKKAAGGAGAADEEEDDEMDESEN